MSYILAHKLTDPTLMWDACRMTTRSEKQSTVSLESIYRCEHSPIRTQLFWIEMFDIPTYVSVHFVRHKVGVEHFVQSNRTDRGGSDDLTRMAPVNHGMLVNAQALIQMARKRLCHKADERTREVMREVRKAVGLVDPELIPFMVPECVYRNGLCPELKPCGKTQVRGGGVS